MAPESARQAMRCSNCGAVNPPGIEFREVLQASYHPSPASERALPCGPVVGDTYSRPDEAPESVPSGGEAPG